MAEIAPWIDSVSSASTKFEARECESSSRSGGRKKRTRRSEQIRRVRPRLLSPARPTSIHDSPEDSSDDASETKSTADASSSSSSPSAISSGPCWNIEPTSFTRLDSQTLERNPRVLLQQCNPPIRIRQPDRDTQIASADKLEEILSDGFATGFIPSYYKDHFQEADSRALRSIKPHMFDPKELSPREKDLLETLWDRMETIYDRAKRCNDNSKDKNAWARVVWDVLETVIENDSGCLEINDVQSQAIHPNFLPRDKSGKAVSATVDLVLAFSGNTDSNVRQVYENHRSGSFDATLSPMTDVYTGRLLHACAIQVEAHGGKPMEAEMRLAVYHAAMLRKMQETIIMTWEGIDIDAEAERLIPSMVGWTVIGHKWSLYISSLLPDGSILCQGPFDELEASTSTRQGVLLLLDLVERVATMSSEILWPIMREQLVGNGLKGWLHYFEAAKADKS
ncbi:hypothetical protein BU24DRAFT_417753 [Aaosphaeria arxii CBS 175.79]|uniref:PD-(D/E)XK nuclease-like domain-containing protein n=1 Tax=Aaosphaeria arxii CBS 175.79 TaxID=1450172 RepID=A0A6A5YBK8_9PLEO|nr:uncharacterized protein BU24DRAFT_417753 [Aaosphaeria arxii CBS 175.79]KAF2022101.1 hypothetical protein BU24DRAFT_417753 [Aaosphaeria arxii CBS 175.79]